MQVTPGGDASVGNDHRSSSSIALREAEASPADLTSARRIVACGAGVCDRDDFRLVQELASGLDAAVAGTRPAVDRGFIEREQMIGQTGMRVCPDLYVAVGISGSSQHCTGICEAAKLIAINADPRAPIVGVADHAIVGDLRVILPDLIAALRSGATLEHYAETSAKE
jgi:electron transfer flavoprotein alpha subunit